MFIRKLLSYFWGPTDDEEQTLEGAFEILKVPEAPQVPEPEKEIQDRCSLKKIGTVTFRKGNFYRIDGYKHFSDYQEFDVGAKVSYTVYRDGNSHKVANIKPVVDEWDDFHSEDEKKWFNSTAVGEVIKREGRIIHVQPDNVIVNLNTVSSEFIPKVGDWIQMDVKSELDVQVLNFCGDTLEITKISPLRTKIIHGFVQSYNQITHIGHIDKDVYFDRESLGEGYTPRKGDRIVAEVIESNQGVYTWRAIKVLLQNSLQQKANLFELDLPKLINYENDVEGIKITDKISVQSYSFNTDVYFNINLLNETGNSIMLLDVKFDSQISQIKLLYPVLDIPLIIHHGVNEEFKFVLNAKSMGETVETVIFIFQNYNIGRCVRINLESRAKNVHRRYSNRSNHNLSSIRNSRSRSGVELIRGETISVAPKFKSVHLQDSKVPDSLWNMYLKYEQLKSNRINLYNDLHNGLTCFRGNLNYQAYEERLHTLLHIEEIEATIAMRIYDNDKVCFIRNHEYLMMEVENLSEMRPSIIIGDRIIATNALNLNRQFEGFVHKVTGKHVYLKFSPLMHEGYNGEDYAVHAVQSRMPMRKLHHAVSLAMRNLGKEFLFPSKVLKRTHQTSFDYDAYDDSIKSVDKKIMDRTVLLPSRKSNKHVLEAIKNNLAKNGGGGDDKLNENSINNSITKSQPIEKNANRLKLEWHDKSLNYYQKEAVRNILLGEARPLPYIIFGPPGTGKTVTVVESIVQILKMVPGARLLVAAPSNSAADIIALRLIEFAHMKPGEMVRFVSYKYAVDELLPEKLLPYSATGSIARAGTADSGEVVCENGLKMGCSLSTIGRHLVTIGTCGSIGTLHTMGFPKGHFTHIIIDEAGQLTEPDILIPLVFLDTNHGQAILSGDPMQLGPVILSRQASDLGLGESFLERMLSRFPYVRDLEGFPKTGGYDPRLVTCLVYNYRSLPGIIYLPNNMFYHSELRSTLTETSVEYQILDRVKEILPLNDESPPPSLVFHGLNSQDYQQEDSPSWFNPDEASQVFFYLNELYRLGLKSTDVGIISPYVKQVKHIRELLKEAEFEIPKVGTVEEFQGSEFPVIILSTVRSNKDLIGSDLAHSLGFISNPKRLNVALTRAQSLCIIIGNLLLLNHDPHWRSLLIHCVSTGAYTGFQLSDV